VHLGLLGRGSGALPHIGVFPLKIKAPRVGLEVGITRRRFMRIHYLSILLGLLFGIILLPPLIIHLLYRWSVNEDERLFRMQKRLDNFQEDDISR